MNTSQSRTSAKTENTPAQAPVRRISGRRKFVIFVLFVTLPLVVGEIGARIIGWAVHHFDSFYVVYGLAPTYAYPANKNENYFKFQPNRTVEQRFGDKLLTMRINNVGFRGRDVVRPKPPGVYRIITLGSSSTYGYYCRDDETYPIDLERLLRKKYPNLSIEVVNAGIPTLRTDQILALAKAVVFDLEPDLLTLYEGGADVNALKDESEFGLGTRTKNWLSDHSVLYISVRPLLRACYFRIAQTVGKDPLSVFGEHLQSPVIMTRDEIEPVRKMILARFNNGVEEMVRTAESRGVRFVLSRQAYTNHFGEQYEHGGTLRWESYAEELAGIRRTYAETGHLRASQLTMLAHGDAMESVIGIAKEHQLPVADGITAVDRDRSQMLSMVHLSAKANAWVAQAFFDAIVESGYIEQWARSKGHLEKEAARTPR